MPIIDFADVKEPELIEIGDHPATLTAATYVAKTATSKADYIKLEFTLSDEPNQGRKQFLNRSLGRDVLWMFKRDMISLGSDPEDFAGSVDPEQIAKDNIGRECLLSVNQRPDQRNEGQMQNNVAGVKPAY
jgi:hypothetical protein